MICFEKSPTLEYCYYYVLSSRLAAFYYSPLFGEWIMLALDDEMKRTIYKFYKRGIAVYTLSEINKMISLDTQGRIEANEVIKQFGAFINDANKE